MSTKNWNSEDLKTVGNRRGHYNYDGNRSNDKKKEGKQECAELW